MISSLLLPQEQTGCLWDEGGEGGERAPGRNRWPSCDGTGPAGVCSCLSEELPRAPAVGVMPLLRGHIASAGASPVTKRVPLSVLLILSTISSAPSPEGKRLVHSKFSPRPWLLPANCSHFPNAEMPPFLSSLPPPSTCHRSFLQGHE